MNFSSLVLEVSTCATLLSNSATFGLASPSLLTSAFSVCESISSMSSGVKSCKPVGRPEGTKTVLAKYR